MALRINYNFQSDFTHVNLLKTEREMNTHLERLSTGYRINSAKDDAAGLFIADQLKLVAEALEQGSRNAQDGISAAQIAESSLSQIYDKLTAMYTKAEQAASDTNDANARAALQRDIEKLVDAIQKIANTSEFNGIKLLTGTFQNKVIHFGARTEQTLNISIDSAQAKDLGGLATLTGTWIAGTDNSMVDTTSSPLPTVSSSDVFEINGVNVLSYYRDEYGSGAEADAYKLADIINKYVDGVSATSTNKVTGSTDFNGTGFVSLSSASDAGDSVTLDVALTISGSKGEAKVLLFDDLTLTGTGADATADLDVNTLINKINSVTDITGVKASLDGNKLVLEDVNGGNIKLKGSLENITWNDDPTNDDNLQVSVNFQNFGIGFTTSATSIRENDTPNDFKETRTFAHGGKLTITSSDDMTVYENPNTVSEKFGLNGNYSTETTIVVDTTNYNLNAIDVTTQEGAELAMKIIDSAIKKVDSMRSALGSIQINLQALIDNNDFAATQTREAESRIRNVDFAKEMAKFVQTQTRMQSSIAMLAQANQLPQMVLQLLR